MLVESLLCAAESVPRRVAVADGRRSFDYGLLARLALVLRTLVQRETTCDRVGILLPASTMFPAALYGVLWAGRTAVPLNFLLSARELQRVVDDAGIDIVIATRHFAELVADLPVRPVFLEDQPLKRRMLVARFRRLPGVDTVDPSATAVLLYTSGTTADPKGVELTFRNLKSNCADSIHSLQMKPGDKFLNVLPPFHVFGLTCNVLIPVELQATVFAIPRFSPLAVARAVDEQAINVMLAIPSMYAAVLRTRSTRPQAFRSVELAVSGGEPLPESVRLGFLKRFGVALHQGYGLTETSPVVAAAADDTAPPGTVGRPIRDVELRLMDESRNPVPPGGEGEILVRGPGVMKGYYRKPDETRLVLSEDGWFATGDIGRLDANGCLTITGRARDMLIIGGENVFPREIEAVLETHDGVLQAAVIGAPDPVRGEVPVAFVLPEDGAQLEEPSLRAHAREALAGFKVPKRVVIRGDLPTGPTGKILKRRLADFL